MEAILILAIAYFFTRRTVKESFEEIVNLPIGRNQGGFHNSEAFTEVYLMRREVVSERGANDGR